MTATADTEIIQFQSGILKLSFEGQSEYASRHPIRRALAKDCFDHLAATVMQVPDELLLAYVDLFDDITDAELDQELLERIQHGHWHPKSATEYLQLYIAVATGGAKP
jgi:hypothetical protein